jgi:two-component sensor histidine kinase
MFKFLFITCLLLCPPLLSPAQVKTGRPLNELLVLMKKSRPDTNRVHSLLQLAQYYLTTPSPSKIQLDSAGIFIQNAIELSSVLNAQKWLQYALACQAKYYYKTGNGQRGKTAFISLIDQAHYTGQMETELYLLAELEKCIPLRDSSGMTKIECLKRILGLYEQSHNKEAAMATELSIADVYVNLEKNTIAENEILRILEKYKSLKGHAYNNACYLLSVINRYKGNLYKALAYSLACIQNIEKYGDTVRVDYFYGELALVYDDLGLTEKSIEWYKKTFELRKKNSPAFVAYRTAGFLVQQLLKIKKYKEAEELINNLSRAIPPATGLDKMSLVQVKANYYNRLNQYDNAEKYYLELIRLSEFNSNAQLASIVYQEIGAFYLETKQYDKAKDYLNKALQVSKENISISRLKDIHRILFKADSSTGNYISAIGHMNLYQSLNDSLFNETKGKQIEELLVQYETQKKVQNIKLLEKETRLQQGRLHQASYTRNWILSGVFLLLIILGLLLNRYRLKQRTNKILQVKQDEIKSQNLSLQRLVNEKDWLVKEIHHRVKNNFHTVMGLLATQSGYLKNAEAIAAVKESQHRVYAMSLIHQKLYQSDNLSAIQMPGYIHELVDHLKDSSNIGNNVRFDLAIDRLELDLVHCVPVGLILNEAITNSIKYAFPGKEDGIISISLGYSSPGNILLTVKDNGVGLPPGFDRHSRDTMGMHLVQGLSEDIGGEFVLHSGGGTIINILFKYEPAVTPALHLSTEKATHYL